MLHFVFTVDGDWEEYYNPKLSEEERAPKPKKLLGFIDKEISVALKFLGGKFVHFVHTSPRARDTFLKPEFISRYREIEEFGGNIGVHCHEDDPHKAYYFADTVKMEKAISSFTEGLKKEGITPLAYRGGYMAFDPGIIPILEANDIFLDFSCMPGRYLLHEEDILVSDWRGAPWNFYRMDYEDHRKIGKSKVFEIPVGEIFDRYLYIELSSIFAMRDVAKILKERAKEKDFVVSVLTHSFEFGNPLTLLKIKLALLILKRYGRFISAKQALEIVRKS